jgi:hypothetical protein
MVFPDLTLLALGIFAGVGLLVAGLVELVVAPHGHSLSRVL